MSKKKIRQGQSRWICWIYQNVKHLPTADSEPPSRTPETSGGADTYHLERIHVVSAHQDKIVVQMGGNNLDNKATFTRGEFLACPATYRKARRLMLEALARA